jgi:calcineurin-like phosphoesterase family protein
MFYITSDLHFGHKNIIRYENRPFVDLSTMEEQLIHNWNNTLKKHDKIYIAGDFSFDNFQKTKEIVSKLNGYKILILGNHDKKHSDKWWIGTGFNEIYKYPIIYNGRYIISHEPVDYRLLIDNNYINLHGHLHSNRKVMDDKLLKKIFNGTTKYLNVGVDLNYFTPCFIE